jgi:hypothetical protein
MSSHLGLFPNITVIRYEKGTMFVFDMEENDFKPNIAKTGSWDWGKIDSALLKKHKCSSDQLNGHRFRLVLEEFWRHKVHEIETPPEPTYEVMHNEHTSNSRYHTVPLLSRTHPSFYEAGIYQDAHSNSRYELMYYCILSKQNPEFKYVFHGYNNRIDYAAVSEKVALPPDPHSVQISNLTRLTDKLASQVTYLLQENTRLNAAFIIPKLMIEVESEERIHRDILFNEESKGLEVISAKFKQLRSWYDERLLELQAFESEIRERVKKELLMTETQSKRTSPTRDLRIYN